MASVVPSRHTLLSMDSLVGVYKTRQGKSFPGVGMFAYPAREV